jgi:hypothetical protein
MTGLPELLEGAVGSVEPHFTFEAIAQRIRRRRRARLRLIATAAVIIASTATLVTISSISGHQTTNSVRVQPTAPTGASDVLMFDVNDGILTLDFRTHVAARYRLDGWRPGDQPFLTLRVGDDFVAGWGKVRATPISGGSSLLLGSGVFVPATEQGAVWLTAYGKVQTSSERLVDMNGGTLQQGKVPPGPGPGYGIALTGIPGGLVLPTATGLDIWDARSGRITRHLGTSTGSAAPAFGSMLAWCDQCTHTLELTDLRTGITRSTAVATSGGSLTLDRQVFSPDGTELAVPISPDGGAPAGASTKIVFVDATTGTITDQIDTHSPYASIAWSSDSQRLYVAASNGTSGGEILVHDVGTGTTRDLGSIPPGGIDLSGALNYKDAALLPRATIGPASKCPTDQFSRSPNSYGKPCGYHF